MRKVIAVDFDGTLCENRFPEIGEPNTELIRQLIEEQEAGTAVILWSCRSGKRLREAVKWAKDRGLRFDYINRNTPERIRAYKSDCRKISADVYIDDRAALFKYGERLEVKK